MSPLPEEWPMHERTSPILIANPTFYGYGASINILSECVEITSVPLPGKDAPGKCVHIPTECIDELIKWLQFAKTQLEKRDG